MDLEKMEVPEDVAVPPVRIDLGGILWDLVDTGKYEKALAEIKNKKYKHFVITNSMDLIPVLTLKLQDTVDIEAQECLENMMVHVASVAKVKEVMIVLLEEVQTFRSQKVYSVMLKPMQVALSRLVSTKCSPTLFTWTFKSVIEHIGKMELPSGYNLEGKERILLDTDPAVEALSDNLYHVLDFFKVFYEDIVLNKLIFSSKIPNTKIFMSKTILRLFDKPFSFLDIYKSKKDVESTIHRMASKFISMIVRLRGNPILFFNDISYQKLVSKDGSSKGYECSGISPDSDNTIKEDGDYDLSGAVSQTSLATFFYCLFHQHMSIHSVPCVYHPVYKFISCLPLISQLLAKSEHLAIHKGVLLAKALTDCIDTGTMTSECLDAPYHYHFNKLLVGNMTMVDNKELRISALHLFRRCISNFNFNGRYRLFESMLQSVTHAGVLGFIITEIKQNVVFSLSNKNNHLLDKNAMNIISPSKFTGNSLWKLVYLGCTLPDGERTDMLDWSDKILASLNLILFLIMRGNKVCTSASTTITDNHKVNVTTAVNPVPSFVPDTTFILSELSQHIHHFQSELFTPLQRGLQISREHYELKLKGLKESTAPGSTDVQMIMGDSLLPGLTLEQEKDVVDLALSRFDLINCVLAQVEGAAEELSITCKLNAHI